MRRYAYIQDQYLEEVKIILNIRAKVKKALSIVALGLMAMQGVHAQGDLLLRKEVYYPDYSLIKVRACAHDALAICSITHATNPYYHVEYINDFDHGRQMQTALSFDGLGEAYNPTEAGASQTTDGINPWPSKSKAMGWALDDRHGLRTSTRMAYWLPVNGARQSNWNVDKQVKIFEGVSSPYIRHQVTVYSTAAEPAHESGTFEFLTGYMPIAFTHFYTIDVKNTRGLNFLGDCGPGTETCPAEQSLPVIFATADGQQAMGIYSRDLPQPAFPDAGYGRFRFTSDGVVKWNAVYRYNKITPTTRYSFIGYVALGSLSQVSAQMQFFYDSGM